MAYGLRCWDANGNITLDVTTRITRVLGTLNPSMGTLTGSVTITPAQRGGGNLFVAPVSMVDVYNTNQPYISVTETPTGFNYEIVGMSAVYGVY